MKKARYCVQAVFLLLMIFLAVRHQIYRGGPSGTPPLDSYCPFGGIETAYLYLTSGTFLHRVGVSNFIMLFGLVLMGIVLKSGFCGWICPFGTVQEWIGLFGRRVFKIKRGKNKILKGIDRLGRYLKYLVLILIIVATIVTGRMIFREWDPFIAFFHMGFGELPWTAYMVLVIVILGSLFVMRFWCRYFCPLGVIVGLIGKLGLFKVECENDKCVACHRCEKLCPMGVDIAGQGRITTVECNSCLDCLAVKDVKNAIHLRLPNAGIKLYPVLYPVALITIFFGVIFSAKAAGVWTTGRGPGRELRGAANSRTNPEQGLPDRQGSGSGTNMPDGRQENRFQKKTGGSDRNLEVHGEEVVITGRLSLEEIEKLTGCPVHVLIAQLKLPRDVSRNENIGRVCRKYNISLHDVRECIRRCIEYNK